MILPIATLRELLAYHYDRRERLYDFLAQLTPEEFARDVKMGWQSIRGLLLHSLEAEVFWMQHVLQQGERPEWVFERFPDLAAVRTQAARVREQTESFLHVITHDTHHRAQAQAAARQLGYEPPELDLM